MKAVILCAGEGSRLRPDTNITPKPLLLIDNRPILSHIFDSLPDSIDEIFIVIQEKNRKQFDSFLKEKDCKIKTNIIFQNKENRGTYFALATVKEYLQNEKMFLVLNGDDIFLKEDLEILITSNVSTYGLGFKKIDEEYRTCDLDLEEKKIISFRKQTNEETKKEMPCFSGALVLSIDFFNYKPVYSKGEAGIPDTLFGSRSIVFFVLLKKWFQINTHKDLCFARENLIDQNID